MSFMFELRLRWPTESVQGLQTTGSGVAGRFKAFTSQWESSLEGCAFCTLLRFFREPGTC